MHWFNVKVNYSIEDKETTTIKKEEILLNASTYTEVEAKVFEKLNGFKDISIQNIQKTNIKESFYDEKFPPSFFKAAVAFIFVDDNTEKEKISKDYYIINTEDAGKAYSLIEEKFSDYTIDYEIIKIEKTKITDVWE